MRSDQQTLYNKPHQSSHSQRSYDAAEMLHCVISTCGAVHTHVYNMQQTDVHGMHPNMWHRDLWLVNE